MGRTLFLTGRPGIGKTTVIQAAAELLGGQAGGFYTEEIREQGKRQGFRLVTLDGQEALMAHVKLRGGGRPRVSRYGVDVEAVERVGVAALRRAMAAGQIVVVDEIGKMELFCESFKDAVLQAVKGPYTGIATVMAKPNPIGAVAPTGHRHWVDDLEALPNVAVWEVTMGNRNELAKRIVQWLDR